MGLTSILYNIDSAYSNLCKQGQFPRHNTVTTHWFSDMLCSVRLVKYLDARSYLMYGEIDTQFLYAPFWPSNFLPFLIREVVFHFIPFVYFFLS